MRILCTTHPFPSHLRSLATVLHAARRRGHSVLVASPSELRADVLGYGLDHVAAGYNWWPEAYAHARQLGGELCGVLADEHRNEKFYLSYFLGRAVTDMATDLCRLADDWQPDVILREEAECGAVLAADLLGIPQVSLATGGGSVRRYGPTAIVPLLAEHRTRMGLPSDPDGNRIFPHLHACLMPQMYDPAEFRVAATRFYRHPSPLSGMDPPTEPVGSGLVLATFGTIVSYLTGGDLAAFTALVVRVAAALGALNRPSVLSVGTAVDLTRLAGIPDNVTIQTHAPQIELLRRTAVFLTHGGFNSVRESLSEGVPMVMIPLAAEQHYNARRCVSLGVARHIPRHRATADEINSAVTMIGTSNSFRERANHVRTEMSRLPTVDRLVVDIEEVVASNR